MARLNRVAPYGSLHMSNRVSRYNKGYDIASPPTSASHTQNRRVLEYGRRLGGFRKCPVVHASDDELALNMGGPSLNISSLAGPMGPLRTAGALNWWDRPRLSETIASEHYPNDYIDA